MATWMVHLRIAQQLHEVLNIEKVEVFILGNIAPDSGIPAENGSGFVPDAAITHFRTLDQYGIKRIHVEPFIHQYFTKEKRMLYSKEEYAFFLGYLTHLLTDQIWARDIVYEARNTFSDLFFEQRDEFWRKIKNDWYDLDFMFLKEHPDFEAYQRYKVSSYIQNHYLDFFAQDAFAKRRTHILEFYKAGVEYVIDRDTYLTKQDLTAFVNSATKEILTILKDFGMNDELLEEDLLWK